MDVADRRDIEFDFIAATESRVRPADRRLPWRRRWLSILASVFVTCGFAWVDFHSVLSASLLAIGQTEIREKPIAGLAVLLLAHQRQPWSRGPRRELGSAVAILQASGVSLPELADHLNELAASAGPHAPLTLYSRAVYLLSSGHWKDERPEMDMLVGQLQRHAALQPATWLVTAQYALVRNDIARARLAVDIGLQTNGEKEMMAALRRLKAK